MNKQGRGQEEDQEQRKREQGFWYTDETHNRVISSLARDYKRGALNDEELEDEWRALVNGLY